MIENGWIENLVGALYIQENMVINLKDSAM